MTQSRFWRSIGTISYVLSGIFLAVLAFQALRARFSSDKHQSTSEEHPQSVIIMGIGSRFIAPTRIELRDIEAVINRAPTLFSHIPRLFGNRSSNSTPQEQTPPAAITLPFIDLQPVAPAVQPPASSSATRATKHGSGRRALVLVSSLLLTGIIATSFLFSVRIFSASLGQPAKAQADAAQPTKPAQPTLVRPAFERGIIYPQWNSDGYGVNDTAWQQGIATIQTQTGTQWIEIPVLFSQATSHSTNIQPSASAPSVQSFSEGIARAHILGYKVFFVPLMQVREPGGWSGGITLATLALQQAWFDGYWNAILPYVSAAASLHVEQMAIGTELQALQQTRPRCLCGTS